MQRKQRGTNKDTGSQALLKRVFNNSVLMLEIGFWLRMLVSKLENRSSKLLEHPVSTPSIDTSIDNFKRAPRTARLLFKSLLKDRLLRSVAIIVFVSLLFLMVEPGTNFKLEAFNLEGVVFSNIPMHPSLKKITEESFIVNGVKMRTINFQAQNIDIPKIIEFYKEVLLQRQYRIQQEFSDMGYFGIDFINDEVKIIRIVGYEGKYFNKPEYIFVTILFSEEGFSKVTDYFLNQDQDMPGQDIPWLGRYPKARRTSSMVTNNGVTTVNYSLDNEDCLQCVVSFYKEQMQKNGWLLENEYYGTNEKKKQGTLLDINKLKEEFKKLDISPEQREKIEKAFEQLEKDGEESKKHEKDMAADQTATLEFKNAKKSCMISVAYKELKGIEGRFPPEVLENLENNMKSLPEEEVAKFKKSLGSDIKEAIYITVYYTPSL